MTMMKKVLESSSDVESLEDVRNVLKEVEKRKSHFNYNLLFLERERNLCDAKACLETLLKDGPDSEIARARQLVNQSIKASELIIKENVQKGLQEVDDVTAKKKLLSPTVPKVLPDKKISTNTRLLRPKSSSCMRCQKKTEQRIYSRGKCSDVQNVSGKPPVKSGTMTVRTTSVTREPLERVAHLPRPFPSSSSLTLPKMSTRSILTKKALQTKLAGPPVLQKNAPMFVLIGLRLHKKKVTAASKATSTAESGNVGMHLMNCAPLTNLQSKMPKNFQIQILPSINIESRNLFSQSKSCSNSHYVEFVNEEPKTATTRVGSDIGPDITLPHHSEMERRQRAALSSRMTNSVPSNMPRDVAESTSEHLTRKLVEDELVALVLERLMLQEDVAASELNYESASSGGGVDYIPAETIARESSPTAKEEPICSPSSNSVLEPLVPTPVSSLPSSPSSPLSLVDTPIPTPPSESINVVANLDGDVATKTHEHNCEVEERRIISTPKLSSASSPLSDVHEMVVTPLQTSEAPSVQYAQSSAADISLNSQRPEERSVDNLPSQISSMAESDELLNSDADNEGYSLGEVHPRLLRALVRGGSLTIPPTTAGVLNHQELEFNLTDLTTSTSVSEGEVKPYLYQSKSAKVLVCRFDPPNLPVDLVPNLDAGDQRMPLFNEIPKAVLRRPHTGDSEKSLGEIDSSLCPVETRHLGIDPRGLKNETRRTMTFNSVLFKPSASRQERWSDGEVDPRNLKPRSIADRSSGSD